jgi:hypothetical protein
MRSTLTTVSVAAALLAAGAGPAAARPADLPLTMSHSARHAVAAPSVGVQHRYLGSDAVPAAVESAPAPAAQAVRTTPADGGVNWADVGIGAGLAAALLLSAGGVSAMRHQLPVRTR